MHKYLENPNRSYNSRAKKLQIHPYSCVIQCFSQTKIKNCLENLLMDSRLTLSLRECTKKYRFSHNFVAKIQNKYGLYSFKSQ